MCNEIEKKNCSKCGVWKAFKEFSKNKLNLQSHCKSCQKIGKSKWDILNNLHKKEYKKQWDASHKLHKKEYKKQWEIDNKNHKNRYVNNRIKTNINYKLSHYCRGRVRSALKRNQKAGHTIDLIGCSISELKLHLEKQFSVGMSWDNYGKGADKWNIDHIIPCAFFNLIDPVEQYMCFNFQNMQPLWEQDNIKKSDNY